ncbi:CpaF/VirB11 family protein [Curtobacterium flaccumfaciens pv. flaccumfaciens]|uniref:CpaF/VirB11 family protein n=1 Tax=Curtobacterium TaxID=2034 RepID=UPI00217E8DBD|nr:CpaF/VirB11 family protein [Curtobacterium flaccumfaciens]MCS6553277.1 CpaF/VirB11 family protein [Curtobacterium flaccumfaciens pv. flaccumfaciens]MCS6567097.1 CpaF/VirB11 family protein [Curtobacterium flaccumfaciens pv. flaccumfaciens]MCS6570473.1 CpaF/VirB11 family protein [Curtobacterium flaccumfaciens pv. flaccumfaciens]MCS6586844.1 CpaF/VirB11 family protein [Curtobacterium flaccumfaciens pv. flaccumfaciens]
MADDSTPQISISERPFLADLAADTNLAPGSPDEPTTARADGRAHLFAAANGARLHLVDPVPASPEQPELPAETTAPVPRRDRARVEVVEVHDEHPTDVDWRLVDEHIKELNLLDSVTRSRAEFDVAIASAGPETEFEEDALAEMRRRTERHVQYEVINRGPDRGWDSGRIERHVQAMFDSAFRYGRFQQYLREPDVEDITVVGYDNVMVTKTDGRRERRRPMAENNDDLLRMVADLAAARGRVFARPNGHIDLDIGGVRFSGTGPAITTAPDLTFRKHNLVDIDLPGMVRLGSLPKPGAGILSAAVAANQCILVAGYPAAGKTTFLRALMSAVDPDEKIATIETERELYLGKNPERHRQVTDLQYLPSAVGTGDLAVPYSLEDAFLQALRVSAQRILFGEIRGPEGPVAIKAMLAGKGSLSTIHARNANDALHRFADVLMSEQSLSSDIVPLRQILRTIQIVVYLDTIPNGDGTRRRIVSEIAEVIPRPGSDDGQTPIASPLIKWNYDRETYEKHRPSPELEQTFRRNGLNPEILWEE